MAKKKTKIVSALLVMAAIATILTFVLNLTRDESERGDKIAVESQGQSGGTTAGRIGDTYHVESRNQSGGITAGKVEIDVNPQKPRLALSPKRTKVQVTDGIYEKKFYFGSPEGLALRKVRLKVTFDKAYTSVKADKWVWTGMTARGKRKIATGSIEQLAGILHGSFGAHCIHRGNSNEQARYPDQGCPVQDGVRAQQSHPGDALTAAPDA